MSSARDRLRDALNFANSLHYEASRYDAMRHLAEGGFDSEAEAMRAVGSRPAPATEAQVDEALASRRAEAARIREYVEKHGAKWSEHVRQRWLVQAEMMEAGEAG